MTGDFIPFFVSLYWAVPKIVKKDCIIIAQRNPIKNLKDYGNRIDTCLTVLPVVPLSNAVIHEWAVVIEYQYAVIADSAVG